MSCSNGISCLLAIRNEVLYFSTQQKPAPFLASKIIKAYSEQGLLEEARQLFDEIPDRDVVTWTAMVSGYTSNGRHDLAWVEFCEMKREGVEPNAYTISNVLKACKAMEWRSRGAGVHGLAIKSGFDGSMYVENALVDLYATCRGSLNDACSIFERMKVKTAVSWTTMIAGYTRQGEGYTGIQAFRQMLQDTELNPFNCSIAIKACASVGSAFLDCHETVWNRVRQEGLWFSLMLSCYKHRVAKLHLRRIVFGAVCRHKSENPHPVTATERVCGGDKQGEQLERPQPPDFV